MSDAGAPTESNGISRAAGLGALSSAFTLLSGIARSKILARLLGPVGLGLASEVTQVVTLGTAPGQIFAGPALTRLVAQAHQSGDRSRVDRVVGMTLGLSIVTTSVLGAVSTVAGRWLLPSGAQAETQLLLALAAVAAVVNTVLNIASQAGIAAAHLRRMTVLSVASNLLSTVLVVVSTCYWGQTGQFAALVVAPLLVVPVSLRALARLGVTSRTVPAFTMDFDVLRQFVTLGLTNFIGVAVLQAALSLTRFALEQNGGPEWNGQFQAAWTIGGTYLGVVLSGLGSFVFPRYATATEDTVTTEIANAERFVLQLTPPLVLMAIAAREPVLHLLYDERFVPAASVLGVQLAGDICKTLSWVYAGPFLYRGMTRAFLFTETIGSLLLGVLALLLVPRLGLIGTGYAYLVTYVIYLVVTWWVVRRSFKNPPGLRGVVTAISLSCLAALVSAFMPGGLLIRGGLVLVGLGWLLANGALTPIVASVRARLKRG